MGGTRFWLSAFWLGGLSIACGVKPPLATPPPSVTLAPTDPVEPAPPMESPVISPAAIRCGDTTCELGKEVCCDGGDGAPRCVAPSDDGYPCGEGETIMRCDESADCKSGERCCRTWGCTGGCPEELACEADACAWGMNEVCAGGAACSPGFRCDTRGDTPTCVLDPAPAPTCGTATCAAGELCCWDAEKREGQCAASCAEDAVSFACTSPQQCGGHPCASWKLLGDPSPRVAIHCASPANVSGSYGRTVCGDLADCPRRVGVDATACAETPLGMPSVRECRYE